MSSPRCAASRCLPAWNTRSEDERVHPSGVLRGCDGGCTLDADPGIVRTAMDRLRAVIVGAGMGGLTAALALRQAGYGIELYDRAPALAPAGAGVSLWSNGIKVLNRLGLGE